jgi:hypothetical protein
MSSSSVTGMAIVVAIMNNVVAIVDQRRRCIFEIVMFTS